MVNPMNTDEIVRSASDFVYQLFQEKLPEWAVYHNYEHTVEIVEAAEEIGQDSKLNKTELEIVALAAWFHDTGYTAGAAGHEEKSVEIVSRFLEEAGYPGEKITQVAECIRATKRAGTPKNRMEDVLVDATSIHVGKKKFFKKSDILRTELELCSGKPMADLDWLNESIDYISKNSFRTKYAQMEYSRQRTKNLIELQERLRDVSDQHLEKEKKLAGKQEREKIPVRGIETMLRLTAGNHIHFSSIADHKASMLISTNSLMMTLVVALVGRGLFEKDPTTLKAIYPTWVIIPIIVLMISALATIIFAILSTRPKITSGIFTKEDIRSKNANLLFFGNFYNMTVEDYEWGIREMMKDGDYLYGTMIRDIHSLGRVVAIKFRYLRISYNVFMFGLIATLVSFIFMYLLY
jgi:pycsar effector protein/HD domain-containing protein